MVNQYYKGFSKVSVVVMDDDIADARKINDILVAAGYTVYVSTNRDGSAALVKRTRPVIIIARGKLLDTDACGDVNGMPTGSSVHSGDIPRDMSYVILARHNTGDARNPVYKIADAVRTPINRKELVSSVRALTAPTGSVEKFGRLAADAMDAFDYLLSDKKWSRVYYSVVGLVIMFSVAALTFLAYEKYRDKGPGKVVQILRETVNEDTTPEKSKPEKLDPEKINPEIPDPKKINREPSEDITRQAPPAKDVPEATEKTKPAQNEPESVETPKEKIRPGKTPKLSLKGFYTLRAGAFSERKNADKMVASLNKSGFEAFIRDESRRSEIPYRVYIGRFKDRDDAYEAKARLENIKGLKTILLKL